MRLVRRPVRPGTADRYVRLRQTVAVPLVIAAAVVPAEAAQATDADPGDDLRAGEAVVTHTLELPGAVDAQLYRGLQVEVGPDGVPVVAVTPSHQLRAWDGGAPELQAGIARPDGTVDALVTGDSTAEIASGRTVGVSAVRGTAVDPDGGVYIATDSGVHHVRDGTLTTVLLEGFLLREFDVPEEDGVGQAKDVAIGPEGHLYVAAEGHGKGGRIIRVNADGTRITIAGGGEVTSLDPPAGTTGADLYLHHVQKVAVGADGSVYVLQGSQGLTLDGSSPWPVVLRIAPNGTATRLAGSANTGSRGDGGPASQAGFDSISDITVGADGTVFLADSGNGAIRTVAPDGTVSTVGPMLDGLTSVAELPDGRLVAGVGNRIVQIDPRPPAPSSCDISPSGDAPDPFADDEPGAVRTVDDESFESPVSVATGPDGRVDVIDQEAWRTIQPDGEVVTQPVEHGPFRTDEVRAITHGADGVVYVATAHQILERHPDGTVVALAGHSSLAPPPEAGTPPQFARFAVTDLACGADGALYIATAPHLYRMGDDGTLSTVDDYSETHTQKANGIGAGLDGRLYSVDLDSIHSTVRRIDADGEAQVIAGGGGETSAPDGATATDVMLLLSDTSDVAAGPDDTVYVSTGTAVRSVDDDGRLGTVVPEDLDDAGELGDRRPAGLAVDAHGNVYVADGTAVRVVVRPHELASGVPWGRVGVGAAMVLLAPVAWLGIRRRRLNAR